MIIALWGLYCGPPTPGNYHLSYNYCRPSGNGVATVVSIRSSSVQSPFLHILVWQGFGAVNPEPTILSAVSRSPSLFGLGSEI